MRNREKENNFQSIYRNLNKSYVHLFGKKIEFFFPAK